MGSVLEMDIPCPKCGKDGCRDTYYRTGEYSYECGECGYSEEVEAIKWVGEQPIYQHKICGKIVTEKEFNEIVGGQIGGCSDYCKPN